MCGSFAFLYEAFFCLKQNEFGSQIFFSQIKRMFLLLKMRELNGKIDLLLHIWFYYVLINVYHADFRLMITKPKAPKANMCFVDNKLIWCLLPFGLHLLYRFSVCVIIGFCL